MCSLFMRCLRLLLKEYKYLIKGISTNNFVTHPLFLTGNIEHQSKSNKKHITFYIVIQVLKVLLIKNCKKQPLYHLFLDVSSADIIFHKFLALRSTLTWKKIFVRNFPFQRIHSFPLPTPLKLVSAFFIKFLFFHQNIALQKLWKMFFVSSKKLFSFSRYSDFCIFSSSFPHFPDSKRQMEVE